MAFAIGSLLLLLLFFPIAYRPLATCIPIAYCLLLAEVVEQAYNKARDQTFEQGMLIYIYIYIVFAPWYHGTWYSAAGDGGCTAFVVIDAST